MIAPKGHAGIPAASSDRAAIPDLLHPFVFVGAATLVFGLTAVALSLWTGAPLSVPTERISRAIGVHYLIPFAIGVFGYGIAQLIAFTMRGRAIDRRVALGHIGADVYFLTLFVVVIYFHFHIKMWMPIINPTLFDADYFAIDNRFRSVIDTLAMLRGSMARLLPGVDNWYQVGFLLIFVMSLWFHSIGGRRYHYQNLTAILLIQMVGALTYLVAPAVGPFIYEQGLNAEAARAQQSMYDSFRHVQQFGPAWLAEHGGDYFTAPPAAMPSLHVAVAGTIAYYAFKARLVTLPLMLFLFVWFTAEAVVSRWHYLVDLPAGFALAIIIIAFTNRLWHRFAPDVEQRSVLGRIA